MNDALLVRCFERLGNLLGDRQRLVKRDRAARDALRQILAFDEFHHERSDACAFFKAIDGRNMWMVQGREHFRFALKPREPIVIRREQRRQDLDGDLALELGVRSPIDLPHSALTDQGGDFIDAEAGAGSESQTVWII